MHLTSTPLIYNRGFSLILLPSAVAPLILPRSPNNANISLSLHLSKSVLVEQPGSLLSISARRVLPLWSSVFLLGLLKPSKAMERFKEKGNKSGLKLPEMFTAEQLPNRSAIHLAQHPVSDGKSQHLPAQPSPPPGSGQAPSIRPGRRLWLGGTQASVGLFSRESSAHVSGQLHYLASTGSFDLFKRQWALVSALCLVSLFGSLAIKL